MAAASRLPGIGLDGNAASRLQWRDRVGFSPNFPCAAGASVELYGDYTRLHLTRFFH